MAISIPLQVEVLLLEVYWQVSWAEQTSIGVVQVLLPLEPKVKNASQHCPPQTTLLHFVFTALNIFAARDHQFISQDFWQANGAWIGASWDQLGQKETYQQLALTLEARASALP